MNIFIVYAHPEPSSFNGALKDCAVQTLTAAGHEVIISDLYAMNFNPVAGRHDMTTIADAEYFQLQIEQNYAVQYNSFSSDISEEMRKLEWADIVILQFPFWWYSVPAILKGWIDRVLAYGFAYGGEKNLKGRQVLLSLTTGGPEHSYQPETRGTIDLLLKHLTDGTFTLVGMECLPPFVTYAVARISEEQRQVYLEQFRDILVRL